LNAIRPAIGILLNDRTFRGITRGAADHEAIHLYEQAADSLECQVCYFRLKDISLDSMTVRALIPDRSDARSYANRTIPLPQVIHNRAIHLRRKAQQKLARLHAKGIFIYNRHTRYSKWFIHRLLMQDERLRQYLPETKLASSAAIRAMMRRHDSLIIKPANGSIGRGIMKLEKVGRAWRLTYPSRCKRRAWNSVTFRTHLPAILRRTIRKRSYLVQQRIQLATYIERPFDLRVSVQRDGSGEWQVTGIVGKAAPARRFLTNVAQGGTVYTLEHLLHGHQALDPIAVRHNVSALALHIATHLGNLLPNLADLGLDIGITDQGFPMFIECNCRDLRYSFQEGGLLSEWAKVYYQPLSYGRNVWLNQRLMDKYESNGL
jgi:glutathione synthase/RimK-type ligase-like ATP-grasp enzyme